VLEAAWAAFDETAAAAPAALRKGPRGGGRDTAQIVEHVLGAEDVYARKMGLPRDKAASGPDAAALLRAGIAAALRAPDSLVVPPKGWPPPTVPGEWPGTSSTICGRSRTRVSPPDPEATTASCRLRH
jgi:hypothetical protein